MYVLMWRPRANGMRILAIDPGREKCGFVVVEKQDQIIDRGIVPTASLEGHLQKFIPHWMLEIVLLGDGTFSKEIKKLILPLLKQIPLLIVNEHDSTYRSRKLYFKYNPPSGIWRFIPLSLQVPPEPYDDFAALLLAFRYLEQQKVRNGMAR